MLQRIFVFVLLAFVNNTFAQDSISKKNFSMSAHGEIYYSYSFNKPKDHEHTPLYFNYKRANEVNVNIAFVSFRYHNDMVRANTSFMVGTYPEYNTIVEQDLLRNIYEANAGFKLSKKKQFWLDAGVMPSHLGFESAYGKDCYTLTRSLVADNSPYYEAGVKVSYVSDNNKITFATMLLNGWQRIAKPSNNYKPSWGTELSYYIHENHQIHWNTYIGNEGVDTAQAWRYFSNLYMESKWSPNFKTIIGIDNGFQEKQFERKKINYLVAPVVISRLKFNHKYHLGNRIEYYQDPSESFAISGSKKGVHTLGVSANLDINISNHILYRVEAKVLHDKNAIFIRNNREVNDNVMLTSSIVFWIL